jgi:hypothetical protein
MFKKVLPESAHELLSFISEDEDFKDFYLAGGTALALQIGHRESIDLDFFSNKPFDISIIESLKKYNLITNILRNNSVELIINDTKVSFLFWAFPVTQNFIIDDGVKLLNPIDIGLFKLLALQGRQTKKDIIDLYFIDQKIIDIEELLNTFESNYPKESFNIFDSIKQLFNDELIELSPMPKMFEDVNFEEMKEHIKTKLARGLKRMVG